MRKVNYDRVKVEQIMNELPEICQDAQLLEEIAINSSSFPSVCKCGSVQGGTKLSQQDRFIDSPQRQFADKLFDVVNQITEAMGNLDARDAEAVIEVCFRKRTLEDAAFILNRSVKNIQRAKTRSYIQLYPTIANVESVVLRWRQWRNDQLEEFIENC